MLKAIALLLIVPLCYGASVVAEGDDELPAEELPAEEVLSAFLEKLRDEQEMLLLKREVEGKFIPLPSYGGYGGHGGGYGGSHGGGYGGSHGGGYYPEHDSGYKSTPKPHSQKDKHYDNRHSNPSLNKDPYSQSSHEGYTSKFTFGKFTLPKLKFPFFKRFKPLIKITSNFTYPNMTTSTSSKNKCEVNGASEVNGKCIRYVGIALNFEAAQEHCIEDGGILWVPDTTDTLILKKLIAHVPGILMATKEAVWFNAKSSAGNAVMTGTGFDISENYLVNLSSFPKGECFVFKFSTGSPFTETDDCEDELHEFVCEYPK